MPSHLLLVIAVEPDLLQQKDWEVQDGMGALQSALGCWLHGEGPAKFTEAGTCGLASQLLWQLETLLNLLELFSLKTEIIPTHLLMDTPHKRVWWLNNIMQLDSLLLQRQGFPLLNTYYYYIYYHLILTVKKFFTWNDLQKSIMTLGKVPWALQWESTCQ